MNKAARIGAIALVAMGTLAASGAAKTQDPSRAAFIDALKSMKRGMTRVAHDRVIAALEESPDDANLHAMFGAVLVAGALYPDAVTAFDFATGSKWYERAGASYHASALAHVGRSADAVQLREEFMETYVSDPDGRLDGRFRQIQDHLDGGHSDLAVELARETVAEFPASTRAFTYLAEALIAADELDEAGWWLILADTDESRGGLPLQRAHFHWLLANHQRVLTQDLADSYGGRILRNPEYWVDRARGMRIEGSFDECLFHLEQAELAWGMDPALRLEASRCAEGAGDLDRARELALELAAFYPEHPRVVERLEELHLQGAP